MKKIFLTFALVFALISTMVSQTIKTNEVHNIHLNIPVGDINIDTIIPFETFGYNEMHKVIDFTFVQNSYDGNVIRTVTKDITYQPINTVENIKQLNHGINKFATLEIASICVAIGTATAACLIAQDEPTGALVIGGVGGAATFGLQIAALVVLKNNSVKNLYISDKGVGFKINID